MDLFINSINSELEELNSQSVSLKFIGNIQNLNTSLKKTIKFAENKTKSNTKIILSIAINYGGKWDIINAINKVLVSNKKKLMKHNLTNTQVFASCPILTS